MDEIVWRAAVQRSGLGEDDLVALCEACRQDRELGAQLDYVLPHLALDLSGDFLRHLLRHLETGEGDAVMRALAQTIGTPGAVLRARLSEVRGEGRK